jgi:beta-lactamase class A
MPTNDQEKQPMESTPTDQQSVNHLVGRFTRRRALVGAGVAATALTFIGGNRAGAQDIGATPAAAIPAPESWADVDKLLAAAAPNVTLLTTELLNGALNTVHAVNADAEFPVGSSFKLWILGALALKVQSGEIAWEQEIAIQERYKSVPGGDLRYAPNGTPFTVRYLAERMIQKSDNTATDHVFQLVGRENIEQAMGAMGHSNPSLNIPMMSTRELVLLKFGNTTAYLDAYFAKPPEERRAILENEIDTQDLAAALAAEPTVPTEIDRVEWFATRHDLAATMAWLHAKSAEPGLRPLTEILALETQLSFNGEVWPYVGFKGGSELGVLSGTWLLLRADGRRFVYSIGFKNPKAAIDMTAAVAAMEAARDALAQTP